MPEENFEQQARKMANGFSMEPKPEVWQNVRNAIQQPERKRRVVLWWWLLPIASLGVGMALYTFTYNKTTATPSVNAQTVSATPQTQAIPATQQPQYNIGEDKAKNKAEQNTSIIKENQYKQQHPATAQKERTTISKPIIKKVKNGVEETFKAESIKLSVKISTVPEPTTARKENDSLKTGAVQGHNESMKDVFTPNNKTNSSANDSLLVVLATGDSTNADVVVMGNSFKDSSNIINPTDLKKIAKLHWGITAEIGIAARGSSILPLPNFEKSNEMQMPGSNDSNSGVTGSNRNNLSYGNEIKHGTALGLGIALQQPLRKNIRFSASAAYLYQTFSIATAVYKDSLVLNNSFSNYTGSFESAHRFHFINVAAGIDWHIINGRTVQWGISAGLDNLLLLNARQKISGMTSSSFALNNAVASADSSFSTSTFYKYQPSLLLGVLLNIKTGNQQLQLTPFVRSSFNRFDKTTTSVYNHLFSAGIKAVYFFK